jgi:hypothetical protein
MDEGHLKSSDEQNVTTEGDTIVVEPADEDVVYVPVYNTSVVYGTWPYPSYPPYYWYPPRPTPYGFGVGVAVGFAWGYAWGHCNWGHCDVDVDIDRNVNRNNNINRDQYRQRMQKSGVSGGKGTWQHNPTHRRGVSYKDPGTAQRFNRGKSPTAASRDAFRGRAQPGASTRPSGSAKRPSGATQRPSAQRPTSRPSSSRSSAFGGYTNRSQAQRYSSRGHTSRQSYNRGASRGGSRGGARGGGGRR